MIKYVCAGLAAACFAYAANAADLSMTPIYKSRPSVASELDGRLKSEYGSFNVVSPGRLDRAATTVTPGAIAKFRESTNMPVIQSTDSR